MDDQQKSWAERHYGIIPSLPVPGATKVVAGVSEEELQGPLGPLIGPQALFATSARALAC